MKIEIVLQTYIDVDVRLRKVSSSDENITTVNKLGISQTDFITIQLFDDDLKINSQTWIVQLFCGKFKEASFKNACRGNKVGNLTEEDFQWRSSFYKVTSLPRLVNLWPHSHLPALQSDAQDPIMAVCHPIFPSIVRPSGPEHTRGFTGDNNSRRTMPQVTLFRVGFLVDQIQVLKRVITYGESNTVFFLVDHYN